jgi:aryl-alcohol dehydrogenase-like predicted oxidoreductase
VDYQVLGATGITVSRIALGTMMLGANGNPDHGSATRIIHAALDGGINFIDTADVYSAGESEEIGPVRPGPRRESPGHRDLDVPGRAHG